jgi:hypothetical protein
MVRDNQSEENDNLNKVIHNIEIELVKIYDKKTKGAQIRCREKWVEYGEKNYSYFLGLGHYLQFFLKLFLNAVLEHKQEVLNQHLKEK